MKNKSNCVKMRIIFIQVVTIMIRIAICDDKECDALAAKKVIRNTLNNLNQEAEIEYYLNAKEIQDKLLKRKEPLDLLILDIDMPDISGLDLAEKLRANNLKLLIIFLSNHEEFVFKAIEFQPFRYIRKTKLETEMPIAIQSAVKIIKINSDKQIIINTDYGEMKIMVSDIMYFETEMRKVAVFLKNGKKLIVNKNITEMQDHIQNEKLIMIHRSCVVNVDHVHNIHDYAVTLDNDETLIVSRPRYKAVKQKILKMWGKII